MKAQVHCQNVEEEGLVCAVNKYKRIWNTEAQYGLAKRNFNHTSKNFVLELKGTLFTTYKKQLHFRKPRLHEIVVNKIINESHTARFSKICKYPRKASTLLHSTESTPLCSSV